MQMLIDGEWVGAADGGVNEILDNATGELIETAPHGSALDVTCANEAAQRGCRAMAAMPSHERAALIQRAADALQAEHAALSLPLARENGKTMREVRSELNAAIRIFRGYAEEGKRVFGRAAPLDSVPGQVGSLAVAANLGPYGLQAAIFTRDLKRVMQTFQMLDVGTVVTNHSPRSASRTCPSGAPR